jgi:type I restriction enzyme, S subunit
MRGVLPEVALAEIAKPISRSVEVVPGQSYRTIGVKWWGEGAYERQTIDGSGTAAKTLSFVRRGDLIINKIWVRHGSTAIAGEDVDGCAASGEFPTFTLDESQVAPRWLHWQTKTRGFWAKCDALSQGTSGKNRIKPELFLTIRVPLPPLAEQRRVVARIEELAAQIHEARTLRHQATEEAEVFYAQIRDKIFRELTCERKPIGDVFDLINGRAFKPEDWQEKGRKIVRIQNLKYSNAPYNRYTGQVDSKHLIQDGDVLFAWSGQVISLGAHIWRGEEAVLNQHIFNVRARTETLPKFVKEGFNALIDEMKTQVRGLEMFHIRKQEIVKLLFPVPPLAEQRRIVAELDALQAEVDALKRLQTETSAELDALLPAILDRAFKGEL